MSNPWEQFDSNHNVGEHYSGPISRIIPDLGLFISLENNIEGIVHLHDIDWTLPSEESIQHFSISEVIETVILSISPQQERISLGIKQLGPDPRRGTDNGLDSPTPTIPVSPIRPSAPATLSTNE